MTAKSFIRKAWIPGVLLLGLAVWLARKAPEPASAPGLTRDQAYRQAVSEVQAVRKELADARAPSGAPGPSIRLRSGAITPAGMAGVQPPVHGRPSPRGYPWMVLFDAPIQPDWRAALIAAGVVVRAYLPDDALLVEAPVEAMARVNRLPHVAWSGEYRPAHKIQPLLAGLARRRPGLPLPVTIQTFSPDDTVGLSRQLAAAGATDIRATPAKRWGLVRAVLPARAAAELARLPEVQWVEHHEIPRILNDVALAADRLNIQAARDNHGLDGSGQIVAVADTGLDTGNTETLHPDFSGALLHVFDLGRLTDWSDTYYHGTHVAGSLLGSGAASGGQYRGAAPSAQLVFQSLMTASQSLALPDDLNDLYLPPYDLGARVHSDSWGSAVEGEYNADSMTTDEFIWDHPDLFVAYAAGNEGIDLNRDGVVDAHSLDAPASAKNVLAVGASESGRPAGSGGKSSLTYAAAWPLDYRVPPISSDLISSSPDGGPQGVAAFSSRGPAADGRTKPDLLAPGTDIVSVRSRASSKTGWGVLAGNTNYCFMGGTSMATPLAAGAATLVRQHCVANLGLAAPSAALIKAALVGGARSLTPGQYGTNQYREIPAGARPNSVEGWGQADVAGTLFPTTGLQAVLMEGPASLAAGASNTLVFSVHSNAALSVAMAYSDYPSVLSAAVNLVNDLDLVLFDPDGAPHYPNGLSGPDGLNNVEVIDVASARTGRWTLAVSARNVPEGPQPYALYLRGAIHMPIAIVHDPLPDTLATNVDYQVAAEVTSDGAFDPGSVKLSWIASSSAIGFTTVTLSTTNGTRFEGVIPAHPVGTRLWYFLYAGPADLTVYHPPTAPAVIHSFDVVPPLSLTVSGSPSNFFTPDPGYGENIYPSNAAFRASVDYAADGTNGWRTACIGWQGTGSVAATGNLDFCDITLTENSSLVWQWQEQAALLQTSDPAGVLGTTTWHAVGAVASGLIAPEFHAFGEVPHSFAGWRIDGARWPASNGPAPRQILDLPMPAPRSAIAEYLADTLDSDTNHLPDWFERRYYGSLGQNRYGDADDDGYENELEAADHTDPFDDASYPAPPVIQHDPLVSPSSTPAPWPVLAVVTDNHQVAAASLRWQRNGGLLRSAGMSNETGSTERFLAELPSPARDGDVITYYIEATDAAGFSAESATWTVRVAHARAAVAPGAIEVSAPANTPTNATVQIQNSGSGPLDISLEIAAQGFADDIESGTNGWTRPDGNTDWHVSTQNAASGSNAWYCGIEASGLYRNSTHASLVSPPILLGAAPRLDFVHRARFEPDQDLFPDGIHYWDSGVLEISGDDGLTWSSLVPDGGYPGLVTSNSFSPFPPDTPCFVDTADWDPAGADLAAYSNREVRIRFRFGADLYTVAEGWRIDDVVVSPRTEYDGWLALSTTNFSIGAGLVSNLVVDLDTTPLPAMASGYLALRIHHNDPELASPIVVPIALHNTSRRVRVTTAGAGTADPAGETLLPAEQSFNLELTADAGSFIADIQTNSVLVPLPDVVATQTLHWAALAGNLDVHAVFAPLLEEGSVPSEWLAQHGLTSRNWMAEASLDPDGDALLTWQEHELDSNPTNPLDARLEVNFIPQPEGGHDWRITWHAFTNLGATYLVLANSNLTDNFTVFTNLDARPPVMTSPPLPPDHRFFGIRKQ